MRNQFPIYFLSLSPSVSLHACPIFIGAASSFAFLPLSPPINHSLNTHMFYKSFPTYTAVPHLSERLHRISLWLFSDLIYASVFFRFNVFHQYFLLSCIYKSRLKVETTAQRRGISFQPSLRSTLFLLVIRNTCCRTFLPYVPRGLFPSNMFPWLPPCNHKKSTNTIPNPDSNPYHKLISITSK